jgi:regulator of replication initiation timing
MGEVGSRLPDLEALSGKVYQAKELISRLRLANRELSTRLEEIQRRLDTQVEAAPEPVQAEPPRAPSPEPAERAELNRLRLERREIRERVSHLLQQIESLEL